LQLLFSVQVTAGTLKVAAQSLVAVVQPPFWQVLPFGQSELVLHQLVPAKAGFVLVLHSAFSQMPSPFDAEIGLQNSQLPFLLFGFSSL
jgi:hypothetical protein